MDNLIGHSLRPLSAKKKAGVILCAIILAALLVMAGYLWGIASSTRTAIPAPTETFTPTALPTTTFTSQPTATIAVKPTPSQTSSLGIGSTWTRPADGMVMVYVPEGSFTMGIKVDQAMVACLKFQNDCLQGWFTNEQPPHRVSLDTYWIDKTDVTNAMYALCVKARACRAPRKSSSYARTNYYGNPQYADYPVTYVDWTDANAYCTWAGARLPTEAEWEKAARGTDGRIYPWGNSLPTCQLLNFPPGLNSGCVGDTTVVGNYPSGASPYGALDMVGNVWQWVNDWYSDTYYSQSPESNPPGPMSGSGRVLRGGSFPYNTGDLSLSTNRGWFPAESLEAHLGIGFRCAGSAKP